MNTTPQRNNLLKALQKKLEQHEKAELIAIIQRMLRQEPDMQWLLTTPLPTSSSQTVTIDPKLYRQQVLVAVAVGNQHRKYKHHEIERWLLAIKVIADAFIKYKQYAAALTIYDVLVTEVIAHYSNYPDEYIAFSIILNGCIDGLGTCLAYKKQDQKTRLNILQVFFAIYRFYIDNSMDLSTDIASILVKNTTPKEQQIVMDWVHGAISANKETGRSAESNRRDYKILLASSARANKR